MTGMNLVPYNVFLFFIGIFLWFAVGFMWKDKAIMVVHVGAVCVAASWIFECVMELGRYCPLLYTIFSFVIWHFIPKYKGNEKGAHYANS